MVNTANCVAWVRKGDEEHDGCVVVLCNGKGDGEKKCEIGKEHAGEKWTDVLGWHQGEVTIDEGESIFRSEMELTMTCRGMGRVLLVA